LRSAVKVRRTGRAAAWAAEEDDMEAKAAIAPGRSEHDAAALRRAWGSAACEGGDGDGRDAVAQQHSIGI
jgi:hypothetical protein